MGLLFSDIPPSQKKTTEKIWAPTFFGPRVPGDVSALQEKEAAREALKEAAAKPEMSRPWPWQR